MPQLPAAWHAINYVPMAANADGVSALTGTWQAALLRMLPPALSSLGPLSYWFASWYITKYEAKYADLSALINLDEVTTADALLSFHILLLSHEPLRLLCFVRTSIFCKYPTVMFAS